MKEFTFSILIFFIPTIFIILALFSFVLREKLKIISYNKKIAPLLFPIFFLLFASFKLELIRKLLEWLGFSMPMILAILVFAFIDNLVIILNKEKRISNVLTIYNYYLKNDFREFLLVLILSFLSALAFFFRTKAISAYPTFNALTIFLVVLLFLPLFLHHYRQATYKINSNINWRKLLIVLSKSLFIIICPLIFTKLLVIFFLTASISGIGIIIFLLILELVVFILLKKRLIQLPRIINNSAWYIKIKFKSSQTFKKILLYSYNHIEISSVILLLIILSWPIAIFRINEYQNWRSNFPRIIYATPVIGMQGTVIILTGVNFGTTGLGIPGNVIIGNSKLITPEWDDNKIVAVVPVPPPKGSLYIRKNFMWKAKKYVVESNLLEFRNLDWNNAKAEDIEKFLELLQEQYKQSNKK